MTKINFIYDHAMASSLVAINAKAEGDLVISGTKGYVYVPAPWWKTEYYELRYEDVNKNSKYFYKFDGDGLRYEIIEFIKSIRDEQSKNNLMMSYDDMLEESRVLTIFNSGKNTKLI